MIFINCSSTYRHHEKWEENDAVYYVHLTTDGTITTFTCSIYCPEYDSGKCPHNRDFRKCVELHSDEIPTELCLRLL